MATLIIILSHQTRIEFLRELQVAHYTEYEKSELKIKLLFNIENFEIKMKLLDNIENFDSL